MATSARKQSELLEREGLILDTARGMLVERGYLGLTMDRIAAATEYSKGTIYQHFPNKEEILAALAIQSAEKRVALFERAATFQGKPRERLAGVGLANELFVRLYPQHFECERMVDSSSIRAKTSENRARELDALEFGCVNVVQGLVRDAVAQGDLAFEDPQTPHSIVFGLWTMSYGANLLGQSPDQPLEQKLGFPDARTPLFRNYQTLLDGYGWKPLSHEWDYAASVERIQREVFADECRRAFAS